MVVAVQRPQQKKDPLQKIAQGVQLASGILGLKQQIDTEMKDPNEISEQQRLGLLKDYQQVEPGTEGSVSFTGQKGEQYSFLPKAPTISPDVKAQIASREKIAGKQYAYKQAESDKKFKALADKIDSEKKKYRSKVEKDLRNEYWREGAKYTSESMRAFAKLKAAGETKTPTPATDLALIFNYMKVLDPESTVREGEQASVENSGAIPTTLRNLYNKTLTTGEKLQPFQRMQYVRSGAETLKSQLEMQLQNDMRFSELAKRDGADVEDVINLQFQQAFDELNERYFNQTGGGTINNIGLPGESKAMGDEGDGDARDQLLNMDF